MLVKAVPGGLCPMETNPREHITDADPVEVPDTTYYQRLVDEGSLVLVITKPAAGKKEINTDGQ